VFLLHWEGAQLKINSWLAGTIKLPFRKLNSILSAHLCSLCNCDGTQGPGRRQPLRN
jgi:phage gp36-like protein